VSTTVLVLSVDEAPRLERSLPAIAGQGDVVVVDNACTDGTLEVAERCGVRVLRLAHRHSYAGAINAAIAATGGDAVLLLNADCVVAPGFAGALRAALDADSRLGSVAPRLLRASGLDEGDRLEEIDAAGMVVTRWAKNRPVGHGLPADAYATAGPAFGGDGAAVLWRREALEDCAVGAEVLDEDMALWATESDLAWRAQLRGWRCAYEPAAVAWHVRTYRPSVPRGELDGAHRRMQFRNRLLMLAKNATLTHDLAFVAAYEVAALGHALLRERELLGAYADAWRLRDGVRRRRRVVQARRRVRRPPFGLTPPR
jgi:GT2 family glycosyltransferase